MPEDLEVKVHPNPVSAPKVEAGLSTYFGFGMALLTAVAALVAALQGNDTATVTAGAGGVLLALGTIGGRMAQALVIARRVAIAAQPFVTALAELDDPETATIADHDLPSDEEELTGLPPADRITDLDELDNPDEPNARQPSQP